MAMALCQECGEELLDQMATCSHCTEPTAEQIVQEKRQSTRQMILGVTFIGSLGAATACNMFGYTAWAMGLGMIGLASMAILTLNLCTSRQK